MARTLTLPDPFHGAELKRFVAAPMQTLRSGDPIAVFELDERQVTLTADCDGVILRLLARPGARYAANAAVAIMGAADENIGYVPSTIRCVCVAARQDCGECGNKYPINGFFEQVRCTTCGEMQRMRGRLWNQIAKQVGEALASGVSAPAGFSDVEVQCADLPPLCRRCSALMPWTSVTDAWHRAQQTGPVTVPCQGCSEAHALRVPPAWAFEHLPRLELTIGETGLLAQAAPGGPRPTIFECPGCTAALKVDGTKRIVECAYCRSDVYLPADLWMHFNPQAKKTRWWLLLRP